MRCHGNVKAIAQSLVGCESSLLCTPQLAVTRGNEGMREGNMSADVGHDRKQVPS